MKEYYFSGTLQHLRAFSMFGIRYKAGHAAHLPHGTPADTLIIMKEGCVRCSIAGQEDILLLPGTVTCFRKNQPRTSCYLTDTHLISLHLTADPSFLTEPSVQIPISGLDAHAAACLDALMRAASGRASLSEPMAASCLFGLLAGFIHPAADEIPVKYLAVHAAKCSIDREFTEDRPIIEYARAAAMSESTFRRLFTEYTGEPPVRYRLLQRLEYVRALVASGECSLGEASVRAGFNSLSYLCRQFRKVYGQSISQYIRSLQNSGL